MSQHTIQVSDALYKQLTKWAKLEKRSMEQVVERLLSEELAFLLEQDEVEHLPFDENDDVAAREAFYRLTTLFADVQIPNLRQVLDDPMLQLASVGLLFNSSTNAITKSRLQ